MSTTITKRIGGAQGITVQGDGPGSFTQNAIARLSANGDIDDSVITIDDSGVMSGGTFDAEMIGESIHAATADATPDWLNDYAFGYDASADTGKKWLLSTVFSEKLLSNRSYYLSTAGSDSATGLSVGAPFLTFAKFLAVCAGLILGPYTVTLNVLNGPWTVAFKVDEGSVGPGNYDVVGDEATPSNVTISLTTGVNACIDVKRNAGIWTFRGIKVTATNGSQGLFAIGTKANHRNMEFGAFTGGGYQIAALNGAIIERLASPGGAKTISGGAAGHFYCDNYSRIEEHGSAVTSNTPAFTSAFATTHAPCTLHDESVYSGTGATGQRYLVNLGGVMDTVPATETYFPGNSAGVNQGGFYNGTFASLGTVTNDDANTGNVGQYLETILASGSAVALTTVTDKTITSISLTAGDWDVWGLAYFTGNAATTVTVIGASISATNNTLDTTAGRFHTVYGGGLTLFNNGFTNVSAPIPPVRISIAATTTIYLIGYCQFGVSTASAFGAIKARRVR